MIPSEELVLDCHHELESLHHTVFPRMIHVAARAVSPLPSKMVGTLHAVDTKPRPPLTRALQPPLLLLLLLLLGDDPADPCEAFSL